MDHFCNNIHLFLPPEDDEGCIEYKWSLVNINKARRAKISSQMRWRVKVASDINSALYVLGVHDGGELTGLDRKDILASYANLMECATTVGLCTCLRRLKCIKEEKYWAIVQVFVKYGNKELPIVPAHQIPDYLDI